MRAVKVLFCAFVVGVLSPGASATALDDYVAAVDASYGWTLGVTTPGAGYTDYQILMDSQTWSPPGGTDQPLWSHYLIITVPGTVSSTTGLLWINGGTKFNAPSTNDGGVHDFAQMTSSVIALLYQVPNQPLTFLDDPESKVRTEDDQIAYAWRKYLDTGNTLWLSRLPMTKAAVRAMDTITAFCASAAGGSHTVNQFAVTGASKRGWTTWTTAAVDTRVVGIAPMVIDLLNIVPSFEHHFDALGYYQPAVHDYQDQDIMSDFRSPEFQALLDEVGPYTYRGRYDMPKFIYNSAQDEFFLPDSSQFYYDRLTGEKRLSYAVNTGHGLSDLQRMGVWYYTLTQGIARPEISWVKKDDGSLEIQTVTGTPFEVNLLESSVQAERDFNYSEYGALYGSTPLSESAPGEYTASVAVPANGYKAFLVEFKYDVGLGQSMPFVITTEVSVVPDVLPYGPQYQLGSATELLDQAYYDGEASDGSDAAGRWGFFGRASNDGERVAFYGVNNATYEVGFFLVDVGAPDSWRRISPDYAVSPNTPIYWSPDDSALFIGPNRLEIPPPGQVSPLTEQYLHGYRLSDPSATSKPAQNWVFSLTDDGTGDIVALPILADGTEDASRGPVQITDILATGIRADWPSVAPDGSQVAFADFRGGGVSGVSADFSDVYVLKGIDAILAAPKQPGTDISTLAVTSATDERLTKIRTTESNNFAHTPNFSQDKSLIIFSEDWNNVFTDSDFIPTFLQADIDVMIGRVDGFEKDARLAEAGNQGIGAPTKGGTRMVYVRDVANIPHLYMTTLKISKTVGGTQLGNNDVGIENEQEMKDGSGTKVMLMAGTTIDFPDGAPQEIQIETPADPVQPSQVPPGVNAIPVVRSFGPDGTQFSPPITVVISYTDAEIAGLDEANLEVLQYNPATLMYDLPVTTIVNRDLVNNKISFTLSHFSIYGLGTSLDTDGDGINDALDDDDDNDGIPDLDDPYPLDTDNDGLDNSFDSDDDNDGIPDLDDALPYDTDNDGMRNDVDTDDDNDGAPDWWEIDQGTDPLDAGSFPTSSPMPLRIACVLTVTMGILLGAYARHARKTARSR